MKYKRSRYVSGASGTKQTIKSLNAYQLYSLENFSIQITIVEVSSLQFRYKLSKDLIWKHLAKIDVLQILGEIQMTYKTKSRYLQLFCLVWITALYYIMHYIMGIVAQFVRRLYGSGPR